MKRRVEPEILDSLPSDDPEAVGSRRDLRRINALMGNFGWMRRAMRGLPEERRRCLVEIGAGDGGFLESVRGEFAEVSGVDLAPRPEGLAEEVRWVRGDVFEELANQSLSCGGSPQPRPAAGRRSYVLAANLFLHHFEAGRLRDLGELAQGFGALCFSEPWRSRVALVEGYALWPIVNRVTRHDMMVSIRAGFVRGELPEMLGLGADWEVREELSLLGACRLLAWRVR